MTDEELKRLRPGSLVHHRTLGRHVVVGDHDGKPQIVQVRDLDQPSEWIVIPVNTRDDG